MVYKLAQAFATVYFCRIHITQALTSHSLNDLCFIDVKPFNDSSSIGQLFCEQQIYWVHLFSISINRFALIPVPCLQCVCIICTISVLCEYLLFNWNLVHLVVWQNQLIVNQTVYCDNLKWFSPLWRMHFVTTTHHDVQQSSELFDVNRTHIGHLFSQWTFFISFNAKESYYPWNAKHIFDGFITL